MPPPLSPHVHPAKCLISALVLGTGKLFQPDAQLSFTGRPLNNALEDSQSMTHTFTKHLISKITPWLQNRCFFLALVCLNTREERTEHVFVHSNICSLSAVLIGDSVVDREVPHLRIYVVPLAAIFILPRWTQREASPIAVEPSLRSCKGGERAASSIKTARNHQYISRFTLIACFLHVKHPPAKLQCNVGAS